jgi:CMP-N,N'-diacetyllegionaminic acid synthase
MNCVAIIPARGGSVRVPKKNVKPLNGKPLISYTIEQAIEANVFDKIIVSTENDEIALISMLSGAEIMHRPKPLAEDCESELVIKNVVEQLENGGYKPDIVVMLQCTSPLRKAATIRNCVFELLDNWKTCDSVITVSPIAHRPEWMGSINNGYFIPYTDTWGDTIKLVASQDLPKLYSQNGCVYAFKRNLIIDEGLVISSKTRTIVIDEKEAFDIDLSIDFVIAEKLMLEK